MKYLAFILAFMMPSLAAAEERFFYDDNLTLKDLRELEVRVQLQDNATGACWTNLKEVREYAEEKFRSKGIKTSNTEIMSASSKHYWFFIDVAASRLYKDNSGPCVGQINLDLVAWSHPNNQVHLVFLGRYPSKPAVQKDNFNKWTLLALETVFSRFPEK